MIRALAAALVALVLGGTAAAARVDPVAVLMQQSIKQALQADMKKRVPGMRIAKVKCTASRDARKGTCRADFLYKTVKGYYMLKVAQPKTGTPSYRSTSVRCFDAKSGRAVKC